MYFATATPTANAGVYRPPGISVGGAGAVTTAPLHAHAVLLAGMVLDVIRRLHGGNALGRLPLPDQLGERSATRRTSTLIRGQLVADVDDRQGRLLTGPVAWPWGPGRARRSGGGGRRPSRIAARVCCSVCSTANVSWAISGSPRRRASSAVSWRFLVMSR